MKSSYSRLARVKSTLLTASLLSAAPALAQTDPAPAQRAAEPSGLEEIVVTAQKREQNLQDVPISITALSATAIEANRIQDVRDLSSLAPNLSVRFSGGGAQIPNYTLRGLRTSGSAPGTDKGVALYLDGVYIQNVIGSVFDFADIERIEVLKGPQGTLFGRNSTGGAISITTRNPTGEFGVRQEFSYGNYDQFRSKTRLETPQIGPFSAILTYLHSERRGDIRNLGAGTLWDFGPATGGREGVRRSPDYLGSDNVEAVAATLKADLFDGLGLIYKFDFSENDFSPTANGLAYQPAGTIISQLYNASPNPKTPITTMRPKAVNNSYSTQSYVRTLGHNLTAAYRLTDEISFKNILAYRSSRAKSTNQLDGLGGLVNSPVDFTALGVPGLILPASFIGNASLAVTDPNAPFTLLVNNPDNRERQWSNEFQINISTDWFNLTAGYIHFENKQEQGAIEFYSAPVLRAYYGQRTTSPTTPFVVPRNPGQIFTKVTAVSDAWFIQPEVHLTSQIDLIGGLRITKDRKRGVEPFPDQLIAAQQTGQTPPVVTPIRYRDSQVSTMVGVNYKPTNDILLYAKYADGYISGGQLATIAFEPEFAYSYEAGVKADLFDRRFRTNLSVFHVDYKAIQFNTSGLATGVPSSALFGQAVVSSADARARGFEWENTLIPVDGITLTANVGYTDFKFDQSSVFPGFKLEAGAPGYLEFQRPKWTGSLSAQYESGEFYRGGHLVARVDGNFTSKMLMQGDISQGSGLNAPADPALREAATVPFIWLVNARLALADIDVGGVEATVALWGKNIFNDRHLTQFTGIGFGPLGYNAGAYYERARTYGIDLVMNF